MKQAFRITWLLLAALVLATTSFSQPTRFKAVDSLLARWDTKDQPGFALGIIENSELAFAKGYGLANLDYSIPISSESIFRIGSTSKQFTAACILLLERQGKLSLDDKLRQYFTEFPPYADSITIRQLIHHTSGIRDYLTLAELAGMREEDYYSDAEVMDWLIRQKNTNFPPGSEHLYSNSGYWLLGQIVKEVTGLPLSQFAKEQLFEPLGMLHTHFHDDPFRIVPKRATGYQPFGEGGYKVYTTTLPMIGDGGIFSSVEDLKIWDDAYYSSSLLDSSFWEAMQRRGIFSNGDTLTYAGGLIINDFKGLRTVSHGGSFVGYRAEMLRVPEKRLSVILLANRSDINPSSLVYSIVETLLQGQFPEEEQPVDAVPVTYIRLRAEKLKAFTGNFEHEEGAMASLLVEKDTLRVLQTWNGRKRTLLPTSENTFVETGNPTYQVSFNTGDNGEVNAMIYRPAAGGEFVFQKITPLDINGVDMEQYTGTFYSEELLAAYRISLRQGQLYARVGHREAQLMTSIGEHYFRTGPLKIQFLKGPDGQVNAMELEAGRVKGIRCGRQ